MNRASPVELRRALEIANVFARSGLRFVCVPVLDESDHASLLAQVDTRMAQLESMAEGDAE